MKADIPGVSKDDIHVSVDRDVLRINVENKAEKEEEKEEQGRKYHRWVAGVTQRLGCAGRLPDACEGVGHTGLSGGRVSCTDGWH